MTTDAKRDALYHRLQEVLGDEPAETLMAMYTAEPATRSDLSGARDELRKEIYVVRDELRADINGLRVEVDSLKADIAEIRTDIRELRTTVESNVRTFVVTQTSTVLGVAAIVLAYDRLF